MYYIVLYIYIHIYVYIYKTYLTIIKILEGICYVIIIKNETKN